MSITRVQLVGNVSTGASFAGIITATAFSGDGSELTGVGIGTDGNVNTSGIITASTISADEFIGTGDKLIFSPTITSFSPTDGATDVNLNTNIIFTFDQPIYAGVGSIFLRNSSGIGTIIEEIGIGSTSQVAINNQTLTISPSTLPIDTNVYVVLPQGVVTNAVGGNSKLLDTYNFTSIAFALTSITPTDGATNVGVDTNITLEFTSPPSRGTGTIELRSGSTSGTVIESFDAASSDRITISGNNWILDPTSNLGFSTSIHTIIPSTAIQNYVGLNVSGADTHSFTTRDIEPGDAYEGGFLICKSSPTRWVVAPNTSEVSRCWDLRGDANTRAQQVSGCTGWFVPTVTQLQNPGYTCRTFWDSFSASLYWSSTECDISFACFVYFTNGNAFHLTKAIPSCVRAFRCVTY
jgi:hypothetical protein